MSRPVAELQRAMSSQEFGYWRELDRRAPIGAARIDWAAAQIVTTLLNIHRDRDAHPDPFEVSGQLLFGRPPAPAELDDVALSRQIRAALSGMGKKKG